jgi:phosphatidylglycerophosphatase C
VNAPQKIALFDFDGTISFKDSLFEFIYFYHGSTRFYTGFLLLSPFLFFHKLGFINAKKAKEKVLRFFFKNEPVEIFVEKATAFSLTILPTIVKSSALKEIQRLKKEEQEVYVVSASVSQWLKPWCNQLGIHLIATELEINNNCITGKLLGENCNGVEKKIRIQEALKNIPHTIVVAYGDSTGDKEMLALATESFYRCFG